MKHKKKNQHTNTLVFVCVILVWALVIGIVFLADYLKDRDPGDTDAETPGESSMSGTDESSSDTEDGTDDTSDTSDTSDSDSTDTGVVETDPVTYTEATVISAGDIIMHLSQIYYAEAVNKTTPDFTNTFKYIKDIVSEADYAVANFETTCSGAELGYSGYPSFNAPDSSLAAIKDAGFDLMLYANNHCYDKNLEGLLRTQEMFAEHGLDYIGAKTEPGQDAYTVVEINGIRIGMFNYADDLSGGKTDKRTINGKAIKDGDLDYMNLYNLSLLDELYGEVETIMADMEADGVDLVIAYMHWGYEYNIAHNRYQEEVAQELTNRGVDVIIGGHPHVIQDAETLTSETDPEHKTLCFYSLGNFVSNQNRRTMGDTKNSTYTEGGLMVELTVRKYSTGEVMVSEVEQIPTFVHRYKSSNGYYAHEIVPLAAALADPEAYGLTASSFGKGDAQEVYDLELEVIGDTVEAYNASIVLPAIE